VSYEIDKFAVLKEYYTLLLPKRKGLSTFFAYLFADKGKQNYLYDLYINKNDQELVKYFKEFMEK
jgi:hypothetical protein